MSDAQDGQREWRFYIQDMLEFGEKVLGYTEGLTQEAFIADERTYDATLRNIELLGEAQQPIFQSRCVNRIRKYRGMR